MALIFQSICVRQISVLPILGTEDHNLNDDEECAARQMIRHVCVALKRYMESHLYFKYTQMSRLNEPTPQTTNVVQILRVSIFHIEPPTSTSDYQFTVYSIDFHHRLRNSRSK